MGFLLHPTFRLSGRPMLLPPVLMLLLSLRPSTPLQRRHLLTWPTAMTVRVSSNHRRHESFISSDFRSDLLSILTSLGLSPITPSVFQPSVLLLGSSSPLLVDALFRYPMTIQHEMHRTNTNVRC